ncbi:type II secretion system protein [Sideroxydans sp. CL21]|uniref:type II secretion system protein n=1 Tax=Sideroxydans sp. CL21 TaxID=2600596 RepID=UPI0024BBFD0F|nr:type II secretion system protein [Sideroxydans sp. CL21]
MRILANNSSNGNCQGGFTLVEMAVVLLIATILMAGLVPTISSQIDQRQTNETRKQLNDIQQALIGFAIINERLPCPASATSNGLEDPIGGGVCNHPNDGYVPAAVLGLGPVNSQGLVVDAWNNPIRYAVTSSYANQFTIAGSMKNVWTQPSITLDLQVCTTSTGISWNSCAPNTSLSSNGVPLVIFSTGKDGLGGMVNPDEAANLHASTFKTFVSHDFTPTYDDLVVWVSPNTLFNRMVAAGKLP